MWMRPLPYWDLMDWYWLLGVILALSLAHLSGRIADRRLRLGAFVLLMLVTVYLFEWWVWC